MTDWQNRIVAYKQVPANQLLANPSNARRHPPRQREALRGSLDTLGWVAPVLVNIGNGGYVLDGHARIEEALTRDENMLLPVIEVDLSPDEEKLFLASFDYIGAMADIDRDALDSLLQQLQADDSAMSTVIEGDERLQDMLSEMAQEHGLTFGDEPDVPEDAGAQIDRAEELQEQWQVSTGDLWIIPSITDDGQHRLLCGDSTNADDVSRVMDGEKAILCHADPPYGMGKEKDGVVNDNLYREKLDSFQMAWWSTCRPFLNGNASAYIWGNAPDLWRLWYCGGLRDSERLTMRNEIVWNKGDSGVGKVSLQGFAGLRSYAPGSERCLFFMLGEQEFSVNADNYWDGWESIRLYLKEQRDLMGWDNAECKRIAGHSPTSGCHWFDRSQWVFPTRDVYEAWQKAAREFDGFKREFDGFKREFDDLKREFDANRAPFDNTHDNMTDVWDFSRVHGDERWAHATPKPVEMVQRIIKSSSVECDTIFDPFGGSGTTAVACEQLQRQCRMIEIAPKYCAVILQRMTDLGCTPERV